MTKILLVEDDKSLREIYGVRLLAEGYDIISAGDGEEALAMAIKERPALIVSDVMMPKISGFDMLDILRSTTETKEIKVIMMTALSSEDQRQRGEQLGADKYLVKSQVGIEDVVRAVHEVMGDAPAAGAQPVPEAPSSQPTPAATAPGQPAAPANPTTVPAADSPLPQPTAPFSTSRPGTTLAERVIEPLPSAPEPAIPVGDLMEKELEGHEGPLPVTAPAQPSAAAAPEPSVAAPATPEPNAPVASNQPAPATDDQPPATAAPSPATPITVTTEEDATQPQPAAATTQPSAAAPAPAAPPFPPQPPAAQ